jgi:PST family polysaccharide transporter/lipopolysaccharide exporter
MAVKLLFLARTPILARLLSPDDFGLLAIGLVALDILMRITELGMIPALVQKDRPERLHYDVAWSVGVARATIIAVCVYLAAPYIAGMFGEPRATPIIQVLGLRPLLLSLASIAVADFTRNLEFRPLAVLQLSDMGIDAIVSIALAPFIGVWALVAGAVAGPLIRLVLSYAIAPYRPRLAFDRGAAASLVRFGRWIFVSGLVGLAGRFVLQAVISRELGTVELGLYYLAARIAYTTTEVSAELLGAVAFPWFSRLQGDRGEAERTFRGMLQGIAVILIPVSGLLIALAPSIVADILGPQWLGAGPVMQVMVVATMLGAFGDALPPLLRGLGQPQKVALLDLVQNGLLAALVFEAAHAFGLVGAAAAWIPATVATQVVAYFMLRKEFDAPLRGLAGVVGTTAFITVLGAGLAFLIDTWVGGLGGLILASMVGGAGIGVLLLAADRYLSLGVIDGLSTLSPGLARPFRRIADRFPPARNV